MRLESRHELDALVGTFGTDPEWHNKPSEDILRGHEAIRQFYGDLFQGFPDFWVDIQERHVTAEAIVLEGIFGGTHTASWMGIPATGRKVAIPFCAVFTFDDQDKLKSEKAYYDRHAILLQMGVIAA